MGAGAPARPGRIGRAAPLLAALCAFLVLAVALSRFGLWGDVGWDIADGRFILAHGYVPLTNVLSTALRGGFWANSEWLFGVYAAALYGALGGLGVYLGLLPWLALLALGLAWRARPLGAYWQLLWPFAAAVAMVPVIEPRPQVLSYVLFLAALWAVDRARRGGGAVLWLAAASGLLWTQVHDSALLLPLVLGLALLLPTPELGRRRVVGPFLLSLVLLLVRPGGPVAFARRILAVGSGGNTGTIQEWASPDFHQAGAWLLLAILFLALVLLAPELKRLRRWADLVLLLGTAAATLYAVRFLPYFVLTAAFFGPAVLPERLRIAARDRGAQLRSLGLSALLAAGLAAALIAQPVFPSRSPAKAIAYLRRAHAENVFAAYQIGASLELYGVTPYLDSRDDVWARAPWWPGFLAVSEGSVDVLSYLRRYDPTARYVLWPTRSAVAVELDQSRLWRRVLVDPYPSDPYRSVDGAYAVWRRVAP